MTNVVPIEQSQPLPTLKAGGKLAAIVPQDLDSAYRLAKAVCLAGLAPKGLDKPEGVMIAILHGMEVGLPPMMALQKIAVINGRPTIWGDGALGLVRASGICEYVIEKIEGIGDKRVAICTAKRRGEPDPIVRRFSVEDAKRAALWDKNGPWKQFPERMLQMRARAFALRDGFADVLGGLYLTEELQGTESPGMKDVTAPPPPIAVPVAQMIEGQAAETVNAETGEIIPISQSAFEDWIGRLRTASADVQSEIFEGEINPAREEGRLSAEQYTELQSVAESTAKASQTDTAPGQATETDLKAQGEEVSSRGLAALEKWWKGLPPRQQQALKSNLDGWKKAAGEADDANTGEPVDFATS